MKNNALMQRLKRVTLVVALFVVCGILYAIIVHFIGIGIPCVFYEITGLKCGGCGITRGLTAIILRFDFRTMLQYNAFLPFIIVYVTALLINILREYILKGKFRLGVGRDWIDIVFLVLLLVWSVTRNIFGI